MALLLVFAAAVDASRARILIVIILRKPVAGLTPAALGRFINGVRRELHLKGEVNLLVSDSRELRRLNRRFRGKDKATDVLSFPALLSSGGKLAGEVAISATIAAANARRLGHSVAEEVKVLALHGLLHLAGFDHEADQGEMARQERELRSKLGLPVGLIARNGSSPARGGRR